MKEFMLLIRNEIDHQNSWPADRLHDFLNKCSHYIDDLKQQQKLISAQPLVRQGNMLSRSADGWSVASFNEAREVIVGYYHILAEDLDDAISIAKRNPEFEYGTTARVEVRPVKTKEVSTSFVYPVNNRSNPG